MTTLGVFRDDFYNATAVLAQSQYSSTTQASGVIAAPLLASATENYIAFSGQAAVSVATDSAANIILALQTALAKNAAANGGNGQPAGVPNLLNVGFFLQLINNNTGTLTLTNGPGVTISGTATAPTNTSRQFIVTVTSPTTVTFQNVGSGTN